MGGLGRNVVTTYIARFANVLGLFFLFPIVASAVDQESYGAYLLTATLATFFTLDLGMAGSTTRFVAAAWATRNLVQLRAVVASSSLFFVAIGALGSGLVVAVLAVGWQSFGFDQNLAASALVCGVFAAIQVGLGSALSCNRHVLAGLGRLDVANYLQICQIALRVALTLVGLAYWPSIVFVAAVDATVVVTAGLVSWYLRRRFTPETVASPLEASWIEIRSMFGLTRDFLVMSLASVVILQSGSVIVGLASSLAMVSIFAAGQRAYQVARELTNSLTAALLPAATTNVMNDNAGFNQRIYVEGTRFSNALLLALVIPSTVFMPELIAGWLGADYLGASLTAQILIASVLINNQHLVAVPILGAQGDLRSYSGLHVIWAAGAVSLGLWLTGTWGANGMALAIVLPLVLLEPFYVRAALRRLGVGMGTYLKSAVIGPLIPALVLMVPFLVARWFMHEPNLWSVAIAIALWVIFYSAAFVGFGMTGRERNSFLARLRRRDS